MRDAEDLALLVENDHVLLLFELQDGGGDEEVIEVTEIVGEVESHRFQEPALVRVVSVLPLPDDSLSARNNNI